MSNLVIEIINVALTSVPTQRGAYNVAEVTYKNKSFQDKVEAKKIMDFASKDVYTVLSKAKFGDQFFIKRNKNDKGFWDWTNASTEEEEDKPQGNPMDKPTPTPKSTYETAEERAKRQIYIVRQSSITNAIALLTANGGKKNTEEEVIDMARVFEAYVFNDMGGTDKFHAFDDDVPM